MGTACSPTRARNGFGIVGRWRCEGSCARQMAEIDERGVDLGLGESALRVGDVGDLTTPGLVAGGGLRMRDRARQSTTSGAWAISSRAAADPDGATDRDAQARATRSSSRVRLGGLGAACLHGLARVLVGPLHHRHRDGHAHRPVVGVEAEPVGAGAR